jgi:2-phospho-L-lactate guanylyltransferase
MDDRPNDTAGVVIPLRSFTDAKLRLSGVLTNDARVALARAMAERALEAARPRPTVVVSDAPEVRAWAAEHGVEVVADPGSLDAAADAGRSWVRSRGLPRVVVVHADLPFAQHLDSVAADGAARVAVIVPDHRDDGTPVLAVPVDVPFRFGYGPGSAARHIEEGGRCGLEVRVVRDDSLGFDVDVADDLGLLEARRARQ